MFAYKKSFISENSLPH